MISPISQQILKMHKKRGYCLSTVLKNILDVAKKIPLFQKYCKRLKNIETLQKRINIQMWMIMLFVE